MRHKRLARPYLLIMGGNQMGIFKTCGEALEKAYRINTNRIRSSGEELKELPIKIYYEQIGQSQSLIHEE